MVSLNSVITCVFPSLDKSIVRLGLVFSFHVKFSQWQIIALFLHFQCSWLAKQCVATLSQSKPKPVMTCFPLHIFVSKSDWSIWLFAHALIGASNWLTFCYGFSSPWQRLHVFFSKSDWSILLFTHALIGASNWPASRHGSGFMYFSRNLVSVHTPICASNANRSISLCLQTKLWRWMSMTVIWKQPGTLKELQKH